MKSEISEEPRVLRELLPTNRDTLEALGKALRERNIRNVTFAGRGTSDHASVYGQYLLAILGGMNPGLAIPSAITLYGARMDYSGSLVVAVSQSGRAADALAVVERGNRCGAVTLAVTNDPESPVAKAARFHLWCHAGPELSVAATKTFTAQLGIMYLLAAFWTQRQDLIDDFEKMPALTEAFISAMARDAEGLATGYRYMETGFVLSRGIGYPVALETMLKIQETCYVKIKGYSSADFYHGPMAQIDNGTAVIVYAMEGKALEENTAMADRIAAIGARPLVVTDSASVAERYPLSYLLPKAPNELLAPLLTATFAQLFAEALCCLRGGNPDSPRNLQKVTVTR